MIVKKAFSTPGGQFSWTGIATMAKDVTDERSIGGASASVGVQGAPAPVGVQGASAPAGVQQDANMG